MSMFAGVPVRVPARVPHVGGHGIWRGDGMWGGAWHVRVRGLA